MILAFIAAAAISSAISNGWYGPATFAGLWFLYMWLDDIREEIRNLRK